MLETWNLVPKCTQGPLNFVNASMFLGKKTAFFGNNSTFTQSNIVRGILETFRSVSDKR